MGFSLESKKLETDNLFTSLSNVLAEHKISGLKK